KQILRIVHKFIPRFIREQFINDAVAQYSEIKRLNKDAILSAEEAVIEESTTQDLAVEECTLVSSIEKLGCGYKLLSQDIDRAITIKGSKLIIAGEECQKSDINTKLPDVDVYLLEDVSLISRTTILKNKRYIYSSELNAMDYYHHLKRPEIVTKIANKEYSLTYFRDVEEKLIDDKIYIHLFDEGAFNYYHLMVEVVPRFWYTLNILRQDPDFNINDYGLVVDAGMAQQCIQVLKALAGADITIRKVCEKQELYCKRLIYCSPLSYFLANTENPPNMAKDIVIDEKGLLDVRDAILRSLDVKPFKL
ncbi:DUF563 domain-containing protein, partial [Francisella philomiragia]|uniref:glycosyltransferase 61 family protein n=1 Tax=Francisella philomiragia TaxID=28110 RepID=UPI00190647EF